MDLWAAVMDFTSTVTHFLINGTNVKRKLEEVYERFNGTVNKLKNIVPTDLSCLEDLDNLTSEIDRYRYLENTKICERKDRVYCDILNFRYDLENKYKESKILTRIEDELTRIDEAGLYRILSDSSQLFRRLKKLQDEMNNFRYFSSENKRIKKCELRLNQLVQKLRQTRETLQNVDEVKKETINATNLIMEKLAINEKDNINEIKETDLITEIEKSLINMGNSFTNEQDNLDQLIKDCQKIQEKIDLLKSHSSISEKKHHIQYELHKFVERIKEKKQKIDEENKEEHKNKKILDSVHEKLENITPKIENFVGSSADNRFYELDETINRLIITLDRIETTAIDVRQRKISLLKRLHEVGHVLEERAEARVTEEDQLLLM